MPVLLAAESDAPPSHPHLICTGRAGDCDGRGWAWHDDEDRRACFSGDKPITADARLVANAIDGRELPGIDRILAIAELRKQTSERIIRRIFHEECPVCGANHLERAERAIRAAREIVHPGAIPALRRARVAERWLVRGASKKETLPDDASPKQARAFYQKQRFIPLIP